MRVWMLVLAGCTTAEDPVPTERVDIDELTGLCEATQEEGLIGCDTPLAASCSVLLDDPAWGLAHWGWACRVDGAYIARERVVPVVKRTNGTAQAGPGFFVADLAAEPISEDDACGSVGPGCACLGWRDSGAGVARVTVDCDTREFCYTWHDADGLLRTGGCEEVEDNVVQP